MPSLTTLALFAAALLSSSFTQPALAHSWNEQLSLIGPNGQYTGSNGYPRGYVARTDPGYTGDSMMYLIPQGKTGRTQIDKTDLLCHPSQRTPHQSPQYPRLTVAPGGAIAMKYFENGHVSLPQNQAGKPKKGGTVLVMGTTDPKPDEKLMDVLQWTKDGSGGDKRGRLLGDMDFDDGRCYQINGGPISTQRQQQFPDHVAGQPTSQHEQWCESDVVLPTDQSFVKPGKTLTLYWIWQWPTAPGVDPTYPKGKDEYYTTCNDLDVVANAPSGPIAHTLLQQDPQTMAVSSYKARTAVSPSVMYATAAATGAAQPDPAPVPPPPAATPAPDGGTPARFPMASAAPAPAPAQLTPLPLSAFSPSKPAPAPAPAPAPPAAAAAAQPAAAQPMTTLTAAVPAGSPVFMFDGGNIVRLGKHKAKRAEIDPAIVEAFSITGAEKDVAATEDKSEQELSKRSIHEHGRAHLMAGRRGLRHPSGAKFRMV